MSTLSFSAVLSPSPSSTPPPLSKPFHYPRAQILSLFSNERVYGSGCPVDFEEAAKDEEEGKVTGVRREGVGEPIGINEPEGETYSTCLTPERRPTMPSSASTSSILPSLSSLPSLPISPPSGKGDRRERGVGIGIRRRESGGMSGVGFVGGVLAGVGGNGTGTEVGSLSLGRRRGGSESAGGG
ncbi:hypothetical protein BT69DRAFT_1286923 [Atractiella rhizophila]|nr:hypothetical protein BT69DRAFT_1286923 [Atractiella rhizophila]